MGLTYKLVHMITSRVPVSWHKVFSTFYAKHACVTIFREKGLLTALSEIIFRKFTGKRAHQRRIKKLREIRKKDVITVVFQVWSLAKWKSDSVYKAMLQHPKFCPIIWITDDPTSPAQERAAMRNMMEAFFSKNKYRYFYAENRESLYHEVKPDIIFIQEPYEYNYDAIRGAIDGELLCFVCYYVSNTVSKIGHTQFLNLATAFRFVENQSVYKELSTILKSECNLSIVGHPTFDYLRDGQNQRNEQKMCTWNTKAGIKKLIWAPHWTITNESFYNNSTFLLIYDEMVRIARKYADKIHIAFKPHPTLYRTLCEHPDWGREKTEAYYRLWATMPNAQIEKGEYRELFWESDAMIHDCGSFIIEYPMVNKPCLYMQRGSGYGDFNEFARAALDCYTIGKGVEDIEKFITEQVLQEHDPKREERKMFIQQYLAPVGGKTAAENIIETILTIN